VSKHGLQVVSATADGVVLDGLREALPHGTAFRAISYADATEGGAARLCEADLLIVHCADAHEQALAVIAAAAAQRSDRPIVVLYEGSPNGFLRQAFDAGADDLLSLPQAPVQLAFALEKALARKQGTAATAARGELVTVLGPKGGTGKTVTATNLAVALAVSGTSSVVVDLDLQFGDVGLALGLEPSRTIYDLAVSGGTLDAEKLEGFLAVHSSGAKALLAPLRPDHAAAVGTDFVSEVLSLLRGRYDVVIVDTPPAFSPEVIAAVDASSRLCVVGMLDAFSLKDTKIGLETLRQMGHDPRAVTLVLNRSDSDVGIRPRDVEQLLGRTADVTVASDVAIPRALTSGQPIVVASPSSRAAQSFGLLAARVLARQQPRHVQPQTTQRPSRLRRTLARKGS
jgi:pilus assembly protein CpaE